MPIIQRQRCKRFNKINHAYFFLDAVRRKDHLNICRHFLWIMNRQNNQPLTTKSIVSTIAELTKYADLDSRTLTNTLVQMKNSGEIERFKGIHNRVGWNPDATNQVKWTNFNSTYSGLPLRTLSKDEIDCETKLLKLADVNSFSYRSLDDYEHTKQLEQQKREDLDMSVALTKIENLEKTVKEMREEQARRDAEQTRRHEELISILSGNNQKPEEIVEKVKRHLEIVK